MDVYLRNVREEGATPKTPLLSGAQSKPVVSQNQEVSFAQEDHAPQSGHSVRQHRPDAIKNQEFGKGDVVTSVDQLESVTLTQLPPQFPTLNKTFQDHGKLYNELYSNFKDMRQSLNDFKGKFVQETAGIPIIADCLKVLSARCGGAKISAQRQKNCIQLMFDQREVSENCSGLPEDALEPLELYNKVNRLIKGVLDKAPQVNKSLGLVLEDEQNLRKVITKSDLPPKEASEALHACIENISRLRKLPGFIEIIEKYTHKIFLEILEGSKVLLEEKEVQR
ncbi:uncharacterized protein LOC112561252 isoform X2 [Pomacea canaliculata]|uniref:uncharacterized protein LOC112561252 isoform X2 n=1 Tax=Pomacea canaliculata TaxID=400727 RepID=UPI000D72F82C|nr:uncharacterized protein LOC112561252 isoform X2 [Pomacea canaliculata]